MARVPVERSRNKLERGQEEFLAGVDANRFRRGRGRAKEIVARLFHHGGQVGLELGKGLQRLITGLADFDKIVGHFLGQPHGVLMELFKLGGGKFHEFIAHLMNIGYRLPYQLIDPRIRMGHGAGGVINFGNDAIDGLYKRLDVNLGFLGNLKKRFDRKISAHDRNLSNLNGRFRTIILVTSANQAHAIAAKTVSLACA